MTVLDVYNTTVKTLSAGDRLQLAAMILNNIPPEALVDYKDEWSDEDLRDFSAAGWKRWAEIEGKENAQGG